MGLTISQPVPSDLRLPNNPVFQFNKKGNLLTFRDLYSGILATRAPRSGKTSCVLWRRAQNLHLVSRRSPLL